MKFDNKPEVEICALLLKAHDKIDKTLMNEDERKDIKTML